LGTQYTKKKYTLGCCFVNVPRTDIPLLLEIDQW